MERLESSSIVTELCKERVVGSVAGTVACARVYRTRVQTQVHRYKQCWHLLKK